MFAYVAVSAAVVAARTVRPAETPARPIVTPSESTAENDPATVEPAISVAFVTTSIMPGFLASSVTRLPVIRPDVAVERS